MTYDVNTIMLLKKLSYDAKKYCTINYSLLFFCEGMFRIMFKAETHASKYNGKKGVVTDPESIVKTSKNTKRSCNIITSCYSL